MFVNKLNLFLLLCCNVCLLLCCNVGNKAANSKELDHVAELELKLEKIIFLNLNKTVRVRVH